MKNTAERTVKLSVGGGSCALIHSSSDDMTERNDQRSHIASQSIDGFTVLCVMQAVSTGECWQDVRNSSMGVSRSREIPFCVRGLSLIQG